MHIGSNIVVVAFFQKLSGSFANALTVHSAQREKIKLEKAAIILDFVVFLHREKEEALGMCHYGNGSIGKRQKEVLNEVVSGCGKACFNEQPVTCANM